VAVLRDDDSDPERLRTGARVRARHLTASRTLYQHICDALGDAETAGRAAAEGAAGLSMR
jgi:hypothetical protein